jgi:hypothetical protein
VVKVRYKARTPILTTSDRLKILTEAKKGGKRGRKRMRGQQKEGSMHGQGTIRKKHLQNKNVTFVQDVFLKLLQVNN